MAQARKQQRKAKKPKARKPKKPSESELRPHKIVGQLIGARYNEHGEVVDERRMADVQIFRPNFKYLERDVKRAVEQARKAEEQSDS